MSEEKTGIASTFAQTRRQWIVGAVAVAGLALDVNGAGAQEKMDEPQSTGPNRTRTSLHQEVDFHASPHRIYDILMDSKQFAAFSSEPAEISRDAGGVFSLFGGKIVGRNVELVADRRIVQAWRPASWGPGEYTLVKFELKQDGSKTRVVLDHTGFHEGDFAHFNPGWKMRYWEPLTKYLG